MCSDLHALFIMSKFHLLHFNDLILPYGGGCYRALIIEEDIDRYLVYIILNLILVRITANSKKRTSFEYIFQS